MGRCPCGRQLFVAFSGRSHSHEVFRGVVGIDDFDLPVAVGGETGPLKCMRCNRDRGAPDVDHPRAEFLDRRQYSAVAQIPRVRRQARSVGRDALCGADQRGCSCRAICFCNALLRSAAPFASSTVLRCGQSNVNAAADKALQHSIGRARYAWIEGGRSNARVNEGKARVRAGH